MAAFFGRSPSPDAQVAADDASETEALLAQAHAPAARVRIEAPSRRQPLQLRCVSLSLVAAVVLAIFLLTPQGSRASASLAYQVGLISDEQISSSPLIPKETRGDGNHCADDEEELAGLCYAKCSNLTGGEYPYRQNAWMCCNQPKCGSLFMAFSCCKHNYGLCSGFDIAGWKEGQAICPHKPGVCLVNEELFLGVCYKKCSLLTDGKYPNRVAPATCCKKTDASCLLDDAATDGLLNGQSSTNASYDIGGGCDDTSSVTHCKPSLPNEALTR